MSDKKMKKLLILGIYLEHTCPEPEVPNSLSKGRRAEGPKGRSE